MALGWTIDHLQGPRSSEALACEFNVNQRWRAEAEGGAGEAAQPPAALGGSLVLELPCLVHAQKKSLLLMVPP